MTDRRPGEFDRATERQVRIKIQDPAIGNGGETWLTRVTLHDLQSVIPLPPNSGETYVLQLSLDPSVAEFYRQQGRRDLQSELRGLINASRA